MMTDDLSASFPLSSGGRMHTLRNALDMRLAISERGAALVSWWAPDRYGRSADVLLGAADSVAWQARGGGAAGRWAGRMGQGRYSLDASTLQVGAGGAAIDLQGARWQADEEEGGVALRLVAADGEAGFPGRLEVRVHYRLDDDGRLTIAHEARADAPTQISLSAHPYFNLNGGSADVGDHMLQIDADYYLALDAGGTAVGLAPVSGTPFDFRQPAAIGARLGWPDPQLRLAGGFDHCYCINTAQDGGAGPLRQVARVDDPGSGRRLEVATTGAGLRFYSGNVLDGVPGRGARPYGRHDGFCLEAQAGAGLADGRPAAHAAQVLLRPGEVHRQATVYRLSLPAWGARAARNHDTAW